MSWRENATEKLQQYEAMRLASINLTRELNRLDEEACHFSQRPPIRPVMGQDPLLRNFSQRQELKRALRQAEFWVDAVEGALSILDPEERLVLERLYIFPGKGGLEWLCQELNMEQATVYRRRNRALEKFTAALYGTHTA